MTLSTEARTNLNSILTALDEQMQLSENAAYQAALKYNAVLSCFDDISTLTKEATLTAINAKIPSLSNNRIPVELPATNLTADWRILTAGTTTIPAGSCYVYLTILTGTVTINGLTKTATNGINDIVNLESCLPARHPAITIVIPEGASVELIRGF
jgi:hypothetical protein